MLWRAVKERILPDQRHQISIPDSDALACPRCGSAQTTITEVSVVDNSVTLSCGACEGFQFQVDYDPRRRKAGNPYTRASGR